MADSVGFHEIQNDTQTPQQKQDTEKYMIPDPKKVKLNSKVVIQVTRGGKTTKETYKLSEFNPDMQEDVCTFGSPLGSLIKDQMVGFSGSYSVGPHKTEITIIKIT